MKIVFIADAYYPTKGGVQNVTKYLAEGLANKNEVIVITLGNEKKDRDINGVLVKTFDIKRNKLKKYFGDIESFQNYVLNIEADFLIFECCETITFNLSVPIMDKIKCKKVLHAHGCYGRTLKFFTIKENFKKTIGNLYNYFYYNFYYYPIFLKKNINKLDAVISLHKEDSGLSFFNKCFNGKKFILGNAADNEFFEKNKYEFDVDEFTLEKKKYLISVANYRNIKNQIGILNEFAKSKVYLDGIKLIFIGEKETEYYSKLVKQIKKIKLENAVIAYTGVERKYIPMWISNSLIYLTGSTYEEYSVSLIEAMAEGIPFISTNVGNACMLPGGITVNKINNMHTIIKQLLNDKNEYLKLAELGRKFTINNCTIEKCVEKLNNILNEI